MPTSGEYRSVLAVRVGGRLIESLATALSLRPTDAPEAALAQRPKRARWPQSYRRPPSHTGLGLRMVVQCCFIRTQPKPPLPFRRLSLAEVEDLIAESKISLRA